MGYPRVKLLILAFLFEGITLILALLLAGYFEIELFPLTRHVLRDILIGTSGALLPFAFLVFILSGKAEKIPLMGSLRQTVITDVGTIFADTRLYDLIIISLLAGFAEELLFRGIIQGRFGIVVASIIFGFVHLVSPAYMVLTTIIGFYIGSLFHFYDSLLIPVQLHFVYDLGALIYLRYFVTTKRDN